MISFLSDWLRQIVIVVIMAGVAEMLMPRGQLKGYIKVVLGLMVLLAILNPVLGVLSGELAWSVGWLDLMPVDDASGFDGGDEFRSVNRRLTLDRYRDLLATRVEGLIGKIGRTRLRSVEFTIEEDPESKYYGLLRRVNLVVEVLPAKTEAGPGGPGQAAGDGPQEQSEKKGESWQIEPIPPVRIGEGPAAGDGGEQDGSSAEPDTPQPEPEELGWTRERILGVLEAGLGIDRSLVNLTLVPVS